MKIPSTVKKVLALAATFAMLVLLLAADAGATQNTKKKKKKSSTGQTTTQPAAPAEPREVKQARTHLDAYRTEAARQALAPLAGSNEAAVLTARGRVEAQAKNYEAAAAALRQAASMDSKSPAPSLYLGDTLAYAGQAGPAGDAWRQAESRARALTAANPDSAEGLHLLGASQQRQKKFAESAATLERARALAPNDPQIALDAGITAFYLDRWQQAFDLLTAALDRNPDLAYAYYYRGMTCGKLNRKDLLFNDLDRFVKMAPDAPEAASAKQILAAFG